LVYKTTRAHSAHPQQSKEAEVGYVRFSGGLMGQRPIPTNRFPKLSARTARTRSKARKRKRATPALAAG